MLGARVDDPGDVLLGIETHMRSDDGDERVALVSRPGNRNRLALEITRRADPLAHEQLGAADVHPGQEHDGVSGVHPQDHRRSEHRADVDLAPRQRLGVRAEVALEIRDLGEAFRPEQLLRDVDGRLADRRPVGQANPRRLRRRLGIDRVGSEPEHSRRARKRQPTNELPPGPALASITHGDLRAIPSALASVR
jgi:hypothetical protein